MDYHFKDFINSIDRFGTEEFIVVHRDLELDIQDGSKREVITAILVPNSEVKKEARKTQWVCNPNGLRPGVVRYVDAPDKYKRWGVDSRIEPLVYLQFFNNLLPERYSVIEEFILLFNLYEDKKAGEYKSVDIHSDSAIVVRFSGKEISIRKHELRKFLALKKMTMFLQFEYFFFSKHPLTHYGFKRNEFSKVITSDYQWIIDYQDDHFPASWRSNARLLGKKAVYGYTNYKEQDIWDAARGKRP
jgi:hypothetical protein